jgi:hypothetical protein
MTNFIIKVLLAHIAGDFLFQPSKWTQSKLEKKGGSIHLYLHILIHAFLLCAFLSFDVNYWGGVIFILATHYLADLTKAYLQGKVNERILFFCDQLVHLIIIALVAYCYYPYKIDTATIFSSTILLTLLFLLTVTVVSAVIIKIIVSKWDINGINNSNSLEKAGTYIGILERLFVFCFIVTNHWEGIGFLLAAKSVFRFGDLSKSKDRKLTEYVLIGSLLSFGIAIGLGMLYNYLAGLV